jgi:glycoside/pentoside/hexuronide:cation symporter, GPH family
MLPWQHEAFGKLLLIFVFNGVASAVPATLLIFFVKDILQLSEQLTWFLGVYFAAAALGMPLWLYFGRRFGLERAWMLGMVCAILGFAGASALGAKDFWPFLAICALTGVTLGADLALPSALLAVLIGHEKARLKLPVEYRLEASYFGLWSLATKGNLALAAGLGLPLLALFGYQAESTVASPVDLLSSMPVTSAASSRASLLFAYAVLPCVLKMTALACLLWFRGSFASSPQEGKPC